MKSYRSLFALAAVACLAFASAAYHRIEPIFATLVATARAFKNLVLDAFMLAGAKAEGQGRPLVRIVQAKAFVQRLMQRRRPELSGSWRLVPST